MKPLALNDDNYRLPNRLNPFQQEMYVHLIDWKWRHITRVPGIHRGVPYDALLPDAVAGQYPMLYPPIVAVLEQHLERFPFQIHKFFNHMASSQAANLNLFLPVLLHPQAAAVLRAIKPDFARLAVSALDGGYRIEFWDEPFGTLGDKRRTTGTDADIAIAYYNYQDELCLWLIEHKLTESEFTTCGGFRSKGRKSRHDCSRSFAEILKEKALCYYHDACGFNYWPITEAHQGFFPNHTCYAHCPFQGGLNQLWRNQLLALGIEGDVRQPYRHAAFSVLKHPRNTSLDISLNAYRDLIAGHPKFSVFTSGDVICATAALDDARLNAWITWYRELYNV